MGGVKGGWVNAQNTSSTPAGSHSMFQQPPQAPCPHLLLARRAAHCLRQRRCAAAQPRLPSAARTEGSARRPPGPAAAAVVAAAATGRCGSRARPAAAVGAGPTPQAVWPCPPAAAAAGAAARQGCCRCRVLLLPLAVAASAPPLLQPPAAPQATARRQGPLPAGAAPPAAPHRRQSPRPAAPARPRRRAGGAGQRCRPPRPRPCPLGTPPARRPGRPAGRVAGSNPTRRPGGAAPSAGPGTRCGVEGRGGRQCGGEMSGQGQRCGWQSKPGGTHVQGIKGGNPSHSCSSHTPNTSSQGSQLPRSQPPPTWRRRMRPSRRPQPPPSGWSSRLEVLPCLRKSRAPSGASRVACTAQRAKQRSPVLNAALCCWLGQMLAPQRS